MNLDIKNMEDQNTKELVKSLELVSARIFESVIKTSQLASATTPEMQILFEEWVSCLGGAIENEIEQNGALLPEDAARKIGVSPATIISLALTLHRQGKIKITEMKCERINSGNTEICGCLKGENIK